MARVVAAFVAVSLLTGCESREDFWPYTQSLANDAWPFGSSETTTAATTAPVNARCMAVAYQRRADAKANGFDDNLLSEVYNHTYAECYAWERDHTGAGKPD